MSDLRPATTGNPAIATNSAATSAGLAGPALIALMVLGSFVLWVGVPLAWLYLASKTAHTSQPTMGPYAMVLIGIPVTMIIVGKLLGRLNAAYGRLTATDRTVRVRLPWLRAASGAANEALELSPLEVIMLASVVVAGVGAAIWFVAFAGSPLPS